MGSQEPTPDGIAELFALDKDIAALCGRAEDGVGAEHGVGAEAGGNRVLAWFD